MQRQIACPLLLHGPHPCAPPLAHPLPFRARGSRHPSSVRECRAARKGASLPLSRLALRPRLVEQNRASAGPPRPNRAPKRERAAPPPPFAPRARERSTRTGWHPLSRPHSRVRAERAWGWTSTWETAPPSPAVPSLPDERGAEKAPPPFPPPSRLVRAKQGAPRMRGTARALCRAGPSPVCPAQSGMSGVGVMGGGRAQGMDRRGARAGATHAPPLLHLHLCTPQRRWGMRWEGPRERERAHRWRGGPLCVGVPRKRDPTGMGPPHPFALPPCVRKGAT